jgi:hypothetical protein
MEATKAINKETKIPQSLLFETSNQISEYYTKQFGLITDFYKKFFDISIKGSNDLTNHSFSSNGLFSYRVPNSLEWPFKFTTNNISGYFQSILDSLSKQILLQNTSFLEKMSDSSLKGNAEVSELFFKYLDLVNIRIEYLQHLYKTLMDANYKMIDFSVEMNKRLIEDLNNQFTMITKLNQKFWSDLIIFYGFPIDKVTKAVKDNVGFDINNKPANSPPEIPDHKV